MKEVKAYIRTSYLEQTVKALKDKGAPGITVVTVHPVGYGFEPHFTLSEVEITKRYYDVTKIELVCDDEDLDKFVAAILDSAHTGASGDGLIFLSEVDEVVKIRTRKRGSLLAEVSE
ncbi:P-II family nitrogen regulator [Malonomonas rubra]|uniref:P-II family nitrogen regulator n=1 Tax=Malonomonas rubra TaxID=57040 RepID=UPI0026EE9354|nr:P-II family nitrogen regulator [Malonomonas rubra]